jgi:hypothetical protein
MKTGNLGIWTRTLADLAPLAGDGGLRAVVGHSFGAMAGLFATAEQCSWRPMPALSPARICAIGAPAGMEPIIAAHRLSHRCSDAEIAEIHDGIRRVISGPVSWADLSRAMPPKRTALMLAHCNKDTIAPIMATQAMVASRADALWHITDGPGHDGILADRATLRAITAFVAD